MKVIFIGAMAALAVSGFAQLTGTYTVAGTSGNYLLDFTFGNNTPATNMFEYFIELDIPNGSFSSAPNDWYGYGPYDGYNVTFLNESNISTMIAPYGGSESGFYANDYALTAPTSISAEGYLYDWTGGGGTYNGNYNPGLTFTAIQASATPAPAALVTFGLGAFGAIRRRRASK
jgi:MYXO-CTERM domain-containing protein